MGVIGGGVQKTRCIDHLDVRFVVVISYDVVYFGWEGGCVRACLCVCQRGVSGGWVVDKD